MPASVGRTDRVVRASKGVPRRASNELTARETAADDIPTLSAAPVKLPRSTMATKISISRNLSISFPRVPAFICRDFMRCDPHGDDSRRGIVQTSHLTYEAQRLRHGEKAVLHVFFASRGFALSACKGLFRAVVVIRTLAPRLARFIHSLAQFLTSLDAYGFLYLGQ